MLSSLLETVGQGEVEPFLLAIRLLLAWLCGWLIALIARYRQPADAPDSQTLTLVLLSILISIATQIIGDNVARAFSLVGALSIVRFRTAVPTTREVSFVLAAVVVGMAVGAGQYVVAALGIVVVGLATFANLSISGNQTTRTVINQQDRHWLLTLVVGLHASQNEWKELLDNKTCQLENIAAEVVKHGAAIQLLYRLQLPDSTSPGELVASLNRTPGIEAVTLKQT